MSEKKRWQDLAPAQRRLIVAGGAVQLSLLASALIDIWRRPREEIRGPKRLWVGVSFVNFIGPLSYFAFGRRKHQADPAG